MVLCLHHFDHKHFKSQFAHFRNPSAVTSQSLEQALDSALPLDPLEARTSMIRFSCIFEAPDGSSANLFWSAAVLSQVLNTILLSSCLVMEQL